ncbi:MAG: HEPN domain-containing protein [bacterium]
MYLEFYTKAKENIEDAEDGYKNARYNACVNRAYYATYQAVIALLIKNGIIPSRKLDFRHSWVQANFVINFIKRKKVFSAKYSDYLNDLRRLREIADYKPSSLSKKDAKRAFDKASELINLISIEVFKQ